MKNILTLTIPVLIDGVETSSLTYDTDEITCDLFAQADSKKLTATGGAAKGGISGAVEIDYSFHLYLGFAAIVAVNPKIDMTDLERIKGPDIMEVMKIGRNFIRPRSVEDSTENGSAGQSETTQEPSALPLPTSGEEGLCPF